MELDNETKLSVDLEDGAGGDETLVLRIEGDPCVLRLTPHQARKLATELILTVNRAEVRSNLRKSQNYTRQAAAPGGGRMREAFVK